MEKQLQAETAELERRRESDTDLEDIRSNLEENQAPWQRYVWKSRIEHLLVLIGYTVGVDNIFAFVCFNENEDNYPTVIHHVLIYSVFALPLLYMEMFLGQYSQMGCLHLGKVAPVIQGVGASMLIISIYRCITDSTVMADCLYYVFLSLQVNLPWLSCPENVKCLDADMLNKCRDCSQYKVQNFSAYMYREETVLRHSPLEEGFREVVWTRAIYVFFCWALTAWAAIKGINSFKHVIRINFIIIVVLLLPCALMVGMQNGAYNGLRKLSYLPPSSLISMKAWLLAVEKSFIGLDVSQAGHILYGSYMPPSWHSDYDSIAVCYLNVLASFLGACLCHLAMGVLMAHLNITTAKFIITDDHIIYTGIPQILGVLPLSQLTTAMFFLACTLLCYNNQFTQVDVITESILEYFPRMRVHKLYIVLFICGSTCLLSVPFVTTVGNTFMNIIDTGGIALVSIIVLLTETIGIMYLYGFQRFSDDIHFLSGFQPPLFWKLCWCAMPVLLVLAIYNHHGLEDNTSRTVTIIGTVIFALLLVPLIGGVLFKVFHFLKYHNLVGLLRPQEEWGPPDPTERKMRHMFNPRKETRFHRRFDTCRHHCILNSNVLKEAVIQETNARLLMQEKEEKEATAHSEAETA